MGSGTNITSANAIKISWPFSINLDDQPSLDLDLDSNRTFNTENSPLETVIQVLGKNTKEWYDNTFRFEEIKRCLMGEQLIQIDPFAVELAAKIKSYYTNKYFINRFKNIQVSVFQETVEKILSQGNVITEKQIPPLLKLPYFYLEDLSVEDIRKNNVSVPTSGAVEVSDEFSFVSKVTRFGKVNDRFITFCLQNSKKQLLSIALSNTNTSLPLWNFLYESKSAVQFSGLVAVTRFKGTSFKYYSVINSKYDIKINKI